MKKILFGTIVALMFSMTALAQQGESLTLANPETKPANTGYRVFSIMEIDDDPATSGDEGVLIITLTGVNGELNRCQWNASTAVKATTLINGMRKANFSSKYAGNSVTGSRDARILHRVGEPHAGCPNCLGESLTLCDKPIRGTLVGSPQ